MNKFEVNPIQLMCWQLMAPNKVAQLMSKLHLSMIDKTKRSVKHEARLAKEKELAILP